MINAQFQDDNNIIKVFWEDTLDNYSQPREKEVEKYFKTKYKTDKVKVIFKAVLNKKSDLVIEGSADASEMVLDEAYQASLVERFIKDNNITINMDHLHRLDGTVNSHLGDYKDNTSRYKQFKIKEVIFDNFCSYGPKNKLLVDGKPGITAIISDPVNYGGKTTATIDLLLFLFFGETTKTEKNAQIFNLFSNENVVTVKGTIEMENDIYAIERTLTRIELKSGEYKVSSALEFYQKLPRGGYKNLKGDEKKLTEELIKTYVGTKEDFLITILSTGENLDDLIKTKPTERGRILTRFIGLEFYREKEKIAKRLHDEWKLTSKLYKNSMENINKSVIEFQTVIEDTKLMKVGKDQSLSTLKEKIDLSKQKQSTLMADRIIVDKDLYLVNEEEITFGLKKLADRVTERKLALQAAEKDAMKPTTDFDIHRLGVVENEIRTKEIENIQLEGEINRLTTQNQLLAESENCVSCKRPLEGVDYSSQIEENNQQIKNFRKKFSTKTEEINLYLSEKAEIHKSKNLWDAYNQKQLTVNKVKFELEQLEASVIRGVEKLDQYRKNKSNVDFNKNIDTQLNILKYQLEELDHEKDMLLMEIKGYEKDIENSEKKLAEYSLLIKEIKRDEQIDKIYSTYLNVYGKNGISKMVLGTMIPLINHHLKMLLSDSAEFVLELRMSEKNEVEFWMVDEETGVNKPLNAGSGYEKTVSSLALRCVLTKVCSLPKPNIIIFDEVFSRVGNDNLDKIGLFFDKLKLHFENIWLISHNPLISDWADHVIKIRKKNNISELISE